ncbi:EamA family transporter [Isoptericola halotolerans]|uniref:EamA family transporter n=1 Tax=Isoptericola halotolerans TaxID=300560 RepID=UPI003890A77E
MATTAPPPGTTTSPTPVPHAPGTPLFRTTALTALTPVVWGTTYLVTTELLPPDHPVFAAAARALPAGLLALALTRTLPRGSWWWRAAVLGVLNIGAFFPLLFVAAERLPGGVAATMGAATPLVATVLAVVVLGERWSRWRLLWGAGGVLGVGFVVLGPDAALDPVGVVAGLGGAAVMALGVTLTKKWGPPPGVGPMAFAGWLLTAGGLALLPLALVEGVPTQVDAPALGGYLWLGIVGGLVAYALWFSGIRRLSVPAVAFLGLLSPLTAAVLGAVVLGESLDPLQLVGFGLALLALVAGQVVPHRRRVGVARPRPVEDSAVSAAEPSGPASSPATARAGRSR